MRVGFFIALRQVKRASIWTNILVVCVMILTFLNLVVVSGILVGLIEGAVRAVKTNYVGDLFISNLRQKTYIEKSQEIISTVENLPGVIAATGRYVEGGTVEADYKIAKQKPTDKRDEVPTSIAGIDPIAEEKTTKLSRLIVEGSYLEPGDYDQVLLGGLLLSKYLDFDSPSFPVLKNVEVGDKVRVTINGNQREVWVKGILRSKVDEIDRRVFFTDSQFRGLIGRNDHNVDEIAVLIDPLLTSSEEVKSVLLKGGFDQFALIQTQDEAEPKFIKDMKETFDTLGKVISSIGLIVACITIFIVIFINAVTRRKFIGIMKGIGIYSSSIEWAYVFQAMFYAILGVTIGAAIVFGVLKPYFDAYPIQFPFSDGILVATPMGTITRMIILLAATLVSGYIPVKLITRQNTLDAILNR